MTQPDRSEAPSVLAETPADMWEDDAWDDLLSAIGDQSVVPIVGPELVLVEVDGRREPLTRFVARTLAERLPWPGGAPSTTDETNLNDVASSFIRMSPDPERQRKTITKEIGRILGETDFPTPEPLRQLAEITPLRLFVNLTFDDLLERALMEVRYSGAPNDLQFRSHIYSTNQANDIELTPSAMNMTRVYNLLGRVAPGKPYVLTEEDLLEHIRYFQGESTRPTNLFESLNRNNLLFLGEGYTDWLARFFIRATKNAPLSWQRTVREFVADDRARVDANFVGFLRQFSRATQLFPKGAVEFVDELHRRWKAQERPGLRPTRQWLEPPPNAVFLSYTRADVAQVRTFKQALEARGVTTWFDEDQLESGDPWLERIEQYIKSGALLFVPILSEATEARAQGKFRREWACAVDRNKDHTGSGIPFIVPIGLKGTSFRRVPPVFREADIKEHDGGPDTERAVTRIAEIVAMLKDDGA
ncbi:MAG TPA: toll/interleukin-1 receptor domain-containing protein [Gemmatimonadaceae bacterium]|nr:toll/interleukin-1 receptor domain-containing protein [Gemmatimonadaceae bacterium]